MAQETAVIQLPIETAPFVRRNEHLLSELKCPTCEMVYDKPVSLTCTHHICDEHVAALVKDKLVTCPVCRVTTDVPQAGLMVDSFLNRVCKVWKGQLKADFRGTANSDDKDSKDHSPALAAGGHHQYCGLCSTVQATHYCSNCRAEMCEECLKTRHSDGFFKTHAVRSFEGTMDFVADEVFCDEHLDEKLNLYCTDCHTAVCAHCLLIGSHLKHKQMGIHEAYDKGLAEQNKGLEKTTGLKRELDTFLESLQRLDEEIVENEKIQRDTIDKEIDHLKELLETKRVQLLSKSELEMKKKKMLNCDQMEKVQQDRKNVHALTTRIEKLCDLQSQHTFLALNRPLQKDMMNETQLQRNFNPAASSLFRCFTTDAAQAALGDLDLGVKERKQIAKPAKQDVDVSHIERPSKPSGVAWQPRTASHMYVSTSQDGDVAYRRAPTQVFGSNSLQTSFAPSQFLPTQNAVPPQLLSERLPISSATRPTAS